MATMMPRGIGSNWLPCGWCDHDPKGLKFDMASFVADEASGHEVMAAFARTGITATFDQSRAGEGRYQVKVGACSLHLPNLRLLMHLVADRFDYQGGRRRDDVTPELLALTVPVVASASSEAER